MDKLKDGNPLPERQRTRRAAYQREREETVKMLQDKTGGSRKDQTRREEKKKTLRIKLSSRLNTKCNLNAIQSGIAIGLEVDKLSKKKKRV